MANTFLYNLFSKPNYISFNIYISFDISAGINKLTNYLTLINTSACVVENDIEL